MSDLAEAKRLAQETVAALPFHPRGPQPPRSGWRCHRQRVEVVVDGLGCTSARPRSFWRGARRSGAVKDAWSAAGIEMPNPTYTIGLAAAGAARDRRGRSGASQGHAPRSPPAPVPRPVPDEALLSEVAERTSDDLDALVDAEREDRANEDLLRRDAPQGVGDGACTPTDWTLSHRALLGCSQAVRQRFLVPCTVGSNPTPQPDTRFAVPPVRVLNAVQREYPGECARTPLHPEWSYSGFIRSDGPRPVGSKGPIPLETSRGRPAPYGTTQVSDVNSAAKATCRLACRALGGDVPVWIKPGRVSRPRSGSFRWGGENAQIHHGRSATAPCFSWLACGGAGHDHGFGRSVGCDA